MEPLITNDQAEHQLTSLYRDYLAGHLTYDEYVERHQAVRQMAGHR